MEYAVKRLMSFLSAKVSAAWILWTKMEFLPHSQSLLELNRLDIRKCRAMSVPRKVITYLIIKTRTVNSTSQYTSHTPIPKTERLPAGGVLIPVEISWFMVKRMAWGGLPQSSNFSFGPMAALHWVIKTWIRYGRPSTPEPRLRSNHKFSYC